MLELRGREPYPTPELLNKVEQHKAMLHYYSHLKNTRIPAIVISGGGGRGIAAKEQSENKESSEIKKKIPNPGNQNSHSKRWELHSNSSGFGPERGVNAQSGPG